MIRRLMTKADRLAARYRPPTYTAVVETDAAAVYVGDGTRRDRPCYSAIGYRGSAGRPTFHYVFNTPQARDTYVSEFMAGIERATADRAARAATESAWINPLKVGDILYSSWGYDQTNVDFYIVQNVRGRAIDIAEIASGDRYGRRYLHERPRDCRPADQDHRRADAEDRPRWVRRQADDLVNVVFIGDRLGRQPKSCSWYA